MAQVVVPNREAAEVSHVEALGNEQLVTCRLLEGSHLVLVRATPVQSVSEGAGRAPGDRPQRLAPV
jgi:hypothetical protein